MLSRIQRLLNRNSRSNLAARRRRLGRSLEQLERRQLLAADLDFSTFFPSTDWEDGAYAVAQDSSGNAYISTYSYDPVTFEFESGISKLSPSGELLWSQQLEDYAWDVAVDDAGYVYVAAATSIDNLPVTNNAFQSQRNGGFDFYVAVLDGNAIDPNADELSDAELVYASYLGGSQDEIGLELNIVTDGSGGIYLASGTESADFPTTSQSGVDATLDGSRDGIVSHFAINPASGEYTLQMSSYVGGGNWDDVRDIDIDANGIIHLGGRTFSNDLAVTNDAFQSTNGASSAVGFVTRMTSDGEVVYGTYFPASVRDIAVDSMGNTYLAGTTGRDGFPVTEGAYSPTEILGENGVNRLNGNYVSKIGASGELELSSWYQLSQEVFQLLNTSITVDGNQPVITGVDAEGTSQSVHLLRFAADFSGLLDNSILYVEPTYGNTWISPSSVVNGHVYVVGTTGSSDFETTPGALNATKAAGIDGYVRKYSFRELLPPTITRRTVTIDGSIAAGASFAVVQGNASSDSHTLSYSITGGDPGNAFSIDAASGKLTIDDPSVFDLQTYQPVNLTVTVADDQSPPQSNSAVITIQPFVPTELAEDDFDTRRFNEGEGWVEPEWLENNYTYLVTGYNEGDRNFAGVMLQDDKGILQRSFDSSNVDGVRLSYWMKGKSFERNDEGLVQVSSDGVNWQTVRTFVNGEDDDTWRFEEIEIDTPGDRTYLRFDAEMSQSGSWWWPNYDYWYVDEIVVTGIDQANRSPLGGTDAYMTGQGQTLSIPGQGVLSNDVDPDGDSISAILSAAPSNGALSLSSDGSFVYSPNAGFSGVDEFSYFATDGDLNSEVTTVSINVVGIPDNDPPTANDDNETTDEDTSVTIDVLANDSDPEGDALTIQSLTQPAVGTASIVSGQIEYTPTANFNGSDSFTYTIIDTAGQTATASVDVTITPVNDAPVAAAESYSLDQDTTLSVPAGQGVLANDSDVDGDSLTAMLIAGPDNGTLILNPDGSFDFTPATGFSGNDSFTYQAVDPAAAASSTVSVALTVNAIASGPNLTHAIVENVSGSWQTVSFGTSYDSAIVVGTPQYDANSGPGVVRIRNVTSTTFEVRVDNVGLSPFSGDVHFIAIEEGVYDEPRFKLEAARYDAGSTSRRGSWGIDLVGYQQSYTSPVVVGQVMTANDADWSVFWSSSSNRTSPANSGSMNIGKHVAEDSDRTRATETLGYFVIESTGGGTIDGLAFTAGVGSDTIRGVGNGTYQYNNATPSGAATAVLTTAGMDGGDGGWAVLMGSDPLPANGGTIKLSVDEDQLRDSERNHTTEQVAYFVIGGTAGEGEASLQAAPQISVHDPLDVNGDGYTSPIDVLQVINSLNAKRMNDEGDMALDVDGDGHISPIDALLVINRLNSTAEADVSQETSERVVDGYFGELGEDEEDEVFGLQLV